jgi:hypothetical protein
MIHTQNGLVPFDRRFYSEFVSQLAERGMPHFPDVPWWRALNCAAALAPCETPLPPLAGQQVFHRANAHDCGHHDPPMRADMVNTRILSTACNKWLDQWAPELSSAAVDFRNR